MNDWPILRNYDLDHSERIALPLGGIGTGTISLGGRGDLRDWEMMNRPAKGYVPSDRSTPFAALWWGGTAAGARVLEGPLPWSDYEGARGSRAVNHGLPRFRSHRFDTSYPFARVELQDDEVPLDAAIEAWNPLVPGDVARSSRPVVHLRYRIRNNGREPLPVSICLTLPNCIGIDGSNRQQDWTGDWLPRGNGDNVNHSRSGAGWTGLLLTSDGQDAEHPAAGSMAIAVPETAGTVSRRTASASGGWNRGLLDFWQDFTENGFLEREPETAVKPPPASLAVRRNMEPGEEAYFPFVIAWHFPNRLDWADREIVGNHYFVGFDDAWQQLEHAVAERDREEALSADFVRSMVESDLPADFVEAALFNLSTLRSQTVFRTADGHWYAWEGINDRRGSCPGTCTHVWNYEPATAALFPDIARDWRETEFTICTDDVGRMNFRVRLPREHIAGLSPDERQAAADGQLGCIVKAHREWRQSGADEWLRSLWPQLRRALEFCWIPGGWDADQDGVMEGCQHNTMDVEYYGPNPQMQVWYLAALQASVGMASAMGDEAMAERCRSLAKQGRSILETELFNGRWFEQRIQGLPAEDIAAGLRAGMTDAATETPELQLGAGCLIDQLVGQCLAHQGGLDHLLDARQVQTTLASILANNRLSGRWAHFNPMRSYVLGDEEGILMASWNGVDMPDRPFPYWGEVMTGFEHSLAVQLIQEGMDDEALRTVSAIRERYDGRKRNPFDEAECGHHYGRALASWGLVDAWSGFRWDGIDKTVYVGTRPGRYPWAAASAWGTVTISDTDDDEPKIEVLGGELPYEQLIRV